MKTKDLIHQLTGTTDFILENIKFEDENTSIILEGRLRKSKSCRCGICGKKAKLYDQGRKSPRRWRLLNVGTKRLYLEVVIPRVCCEHHHIVTSSVPWARHDSWFNHAFEEQIAWLAVHTSKSTISQLMRIDWHTVGNICRRVYEDLEKKSTTSRFDNLKRIGIDETSYKKGHKYLTVVVNHDTRAVIWCHVGLGSEVLSKFFEQLTPAQRESIECVSADGARWIAACVEKYCPKVERCVDPFHVVSWATDALDTVRKAIWKEAMDAVKVAPKRSKGRPKKDEVVNAEKKAASGIKSTRYALFKNPEDLSPFQKEKLKFIAESHPKLYRAYLLKEELRLAIKAPAHLIVQELAKWMGHAQRCRIPAFLELRKKIKRNLDGIIASAKNNLSNARIEATNNKIKLIIRTAYGFRNTDNLLAMIMLSCSELKPSLPT